MTPKEKIEKWLDNPDTPDDAWKTYTYDQIIDETGTSSGSVNRYVFEIIAERKNLMPSQVLDIRNEYLYSVENKQHGRSALPTSYINKIHEIIDENPDIPIVDLAYLVKLPTKVVKRYLNMCKEIDDVVKENPDISISGILQKTKIPIPTIKTYLERKK